MLKKKFRLKKNTAFTATFKLRNCKSNEFVTVYRGKDKDNDAIPLKAGFVVGKKIHKRAVKRNKIKRRLREIYLEALKCGHAEKFESALSVIFVARPKILEVDFLTLKNSVFELMRNFK